MNVKWKRHEEQQCGSPPSAFAAFGRPGDQPEHGQLERPGADHELQVLDIIARREQPAALGRIAEAGRRNLVSVDRLRRIRPIVKLDGITEAQRVVKHPERGPAPRDHREQNHVPKPRTRGLRPREPYKQCRKGKQEPAVVARQRAEKRGHGSPD